MNAHQGILALFADMDNHECRTALGVGQIGNLYLTYVRGDGSFLGPAYEFKLLKSTPGAVSTKETTWGAIKELCR